MNSLTATDSDVSDYFLFVLKVETETVLSISACCSLIVQVHNLINLLEGNTAFLLDLVNCFAVLDQLADTNLLTPTLSIVTFEIISICFLHIQTGTPMRILSFTNSCLTVSSIFPPLSCERSIDTLKRHSVDTLLMPNSESWCSNE